jgi:hypothetical protein
MKTKSRLLPSLLRLGALAALPLAAARLSADTLVADTAVFAQADPKSAVLARLKAGDTVTPVGEAPLGWRRVTVGGPFTAFVRTPDINKGLEVRDGAKIYLEPKKDAPVLTVAAEGDKSEVIGLHGTDWVQIKLMKQLEGFIAVGEMANRPAQPATGRVAPPPAPPAAASAATGHAVPITGNTADLPRLFSGRLVVAKRLIINPNPPYEYQLSDASGRRFAYVDTRRLLLTDKIESYIDREISVTGTVRNTVDGKDLVIAAESMQLR